MSDRLPWDYEAPRWGRLDYTAWRDSRNVRLMSAVARGLYWQLLALQWQDGFVPDDMWTAFRLLDVDDEDGEVLAEIWDVAISHFEPHPLDPTRRINVRQAVERWRAIDLSTAKASAGREGGLRSGKKRQSVSAGKQPASKQCLSSAEAVLKQTRTELELETDNVSTIRAEPDVDNSEESWNARLAPLARELGGEKHIGNWLKWAKPDPDTSERIMLGLKSLRDRGALIWVEPGQLCTPGALDPLIEGQPASNYAESEYWRITQAPARKKPETLKRLQA